MTPVLTDLLFFHSSPLDYFTPYFDDNAVVLSPAPFDAYRLLFLSKATADADLLILISKATSGARFLFSRPQEDAVLFVVS